jgi:hypothetical protein
VYASQKAVHPAKSRTTESHSESAYNFFHVPSRTQHTRSSLQEFARVCDDDSGQKCTTKHAIDDPLAIYALLSATPRANCIRARRQRVRGRERGRTPCCRRCGHRIREGVRVCCQAWSICIWCGLRSARPGHSTRDLSCIYTSVLEAFLCTTHVLTYLLRRQSSLEVPPRQLKLVVTFSIWWKYPSRLQRTK